MLEFIEAAFKLSTNGWIILLMMVGASYTIMSQMLDSHSLAMIGVPFLTTGAAFGQHTMTMLGLQIAPDKFVNIVVGMAGGLLIASIILFFLLWIPNALKAR